MRDRRLNTLHAACTMKAYSSEGDMVDAFNDMLIGVTGQIVDFMYTYILVILLVVVGIWFSARTKFVQIRYFKDMFKSLVASSDRIKAEEAADEAARLAEEAHQLVPSAHGVHRFARGHGQHRGHRHGHRNGRPGRGILDVGHVHRGCSIGVHRVDAGADLEGEEPRRHVPRRPGLLHPASAGEALDGRGVRCRADLVLRVRLQRPSGVQRHLGARLLRHRGISSAC